MTHTIHELAEDIRRQDREALGRRLSAQAFDTDGSGLGQIRCAAPNRRDSLRGRLDQRFLTSLTLSRARQ
jgi:hypothetical protein